MLSPSSMLAASAAWDGSARAYKPKAASICSQASYLVHSSRIFKMSVVKAPVLIWCRAWHMNKLNLNAMGLNNMLQTPTSPQPTTTIEPSVVPAF